MHIREVVVRDYFNSWLNKDISIIEKCFSDEILYIESWGPAYKGKEQVKTWFINWNKRHSVLVWYIKDIMIIEDKVVCEWYFKYKYEEEAYDFNGVSLVYFNNDNKVIKLKEFMSKLPIEFPLGFSQEN